MKSSSKSLQYKVEINPSYEWTKEASHLNISHRELEVFALVTEGYSNKEAAEILKIKYQSVKNHMHSLTKKLDTKNNTQTLIIALKLNLIKVRMKDKYLKQNVVVDIKFENMIEDFRKFLSGKNWSPDITEKNLRYLKVFLKKHGIEPDDW